MTSLQEPRDLYVSPRWLAEASVLNERVVLVRANLVPLRRRIEPRGVPEGECTNLGGSPKAFINVHYSERNEG